MYQQEFLKAFFVGIVLCSSIPTGSRAADDNGRLYAYVHSPEFAKRLFEAAITADAYRRYYCDHTDYLIEHKKDVSVYEPVIMPDGALHATSGLWRVRYVVKRCGERATYNAVFHAREGMPPKWFLDLPGLTRASPKLYNRMKGTLQLMAGLNAGHPNCKDIRVKDTKPDGEYSSFDTKTRVKTKYYREKWVIDVCTNEIELEVGIEKTDNVDKADISIGGINNVRKRSVHTDSRSYTVSLNEMFQLLDRIHAGDTKEPLERIKTYALNNQSDYQYILATLYLEGKGVPKDISGVAYWAMRAAFDYHPRAMNLVGNIYELGIWVIQDFEIAEKWYRKALTGGDKLSAQALKRLQSKHSSKSQKSKGIFDFLKPTSQPPPANGNTDFP